jgi:hypothetical protein
VAPWPHTTKGALMGRAGVAMMAVVVVVISSWPLHLPLNNPNEGVRVFAARSLAVHHTWALGPVLREWGFIDDKAHCEAIAAGALCSSKAPYPSLLAALPSLLLPTDIGRAAFTWWARFFGCMLPSCWLWWGALRALRRHVNDDHSLATITIAAVLGSGVLAGMTVMSGHAASAAAVLWLTALTVAQNPNDGATNTRAIGAGLLAGIALGFEYTAALVVVPLVLAWLWQHRQQPRLVGLAMAAGVVAVTPMMIAHNQQFGAPWLTGYGALDNPAYAKLVAVDGFHFSIMAVVESLLSPSVGLLWFSPWLVFAGWGWRHSSGIERTVMVAGTLLMLLFAAVFPGWRGGWSVGWRYGLPVVALWVLPCLRGMAMFTAGWRRHLRLLLVAFSVIHAGLAGAFFPHLSDAMTAPVHRFLVPAVGHGFGPHSVFEAVGVPSPWAAWVLAAWVLAPCLLLLRRQQELLTFAVVLIVTVAGTTIVPAHAASDAEVRRLLLNWRPAP